MLLESFVMEYDDDNNNNNNISYNDNKPLLVGYKNTSTTVPVCRKRQLKQNTIDRHWKK